MFENSRIPILNPFWKKRKIMAYFIDESNRIYKAKRTYSDGKITMNVHGRVETYLVDPEKILIDPSNNWPVCYYYVGNPNPIIFRYTKAQGNATADGTSLTMLLDNNNLKTLINKRNKDLLKIIVILTAISAGASVFLLTKYMGWL